MRSAFFVLGSSFLVFGALACAPARSFTDAHGSAESLARAVLDAIARRDAPALQSLALSEEEFRVHVWPELPASRPERNMPLSYVWGDLKQKSDGGLTTIMAEHGGRRFELIGVTFAGDTTDYAAFRVHREAVFTVKARAGDPVTLRVCGSMIEKDGRWKVFSYVVD